MKKAARKQGKAIPFHKLHGAGNDILVVAAKDLPKNAKAEMIRRIAHRQLGVGSDQVVEILKTKPLSIQIWNGDGTKAEMCANGSRVFLFLASQLGWIPASAKVVDVEISGSHYEAKRAKDSFELCLGSPRVQQPIRIPLAHESVPYWDVNVGNPHAVIFLGEGKDEWKKPKDFSHLTYGAEIEKHKMFPKKTNVHFVLKWKKQGETVKALVKHWERGAGPTLSCGSGAVAVAAALRKKVGGENFEIEMNGFKLKARFEGNKVHLSGPATPIAEGVFRS